VVVRSGRARRFRASAAARSTWPAALGVLSKAAALVVS